MNGYTVPTNMHQKIIFVEGSADYTMSGQGVGLNSSATERVVLIPIDGSPHSERAYEWYRDFAKRPNDKVAFVNVVEPEYSSTPSALGFTTLTQLDVNTHLKEQIESGQSMCERWVQRAQKDELSSEAVVTTNNRPGHVLVDMIKQKKASMVVMGNRGLGTIRRTILGSVTDYMLHHADVPVVVVPPEKQPSLIAR